MLSCGRKSNQTIVSPPGSPACSFINHLFKGSGERSCCLDGLHHEAVSPFPSFLKLRFYQRFCYSNKKSNECTSHHNTSTACEVGLFLILASQAEKMQSQGDWVTDLKLSGQQGVEMLFESRSV